MSEGNAPFELQVGGAVPLETGAYVVRHSDEELLRAVQQGDYCNVLCPRQMGKTSTILRIRAKLRKETGWRSALIDIAGRLGTPASGEDWYLGLLGEINKQFALGLDVNAWWGTRREPTANQKLLAFFREETIGRHPADHFVVFLDEIDHTLNLPYTDDFFLAIRSLYNDRASEPDLRRLTFCLIGVFTPNELVKQQRTTTYNVGRTFELQDFDLERDDLSPLTRVLSADPAHGRILLNSVHAWTGGQPYLTVSSCKKVAAAGANTTAEVDRTIEEAFVSREKPLDVSDGTHFENIARFLGQRVAAQLETMQMYRKLLKGGEERDRPTPPVLALKLSGLVKTDRHARLTIRNRIYRRRFDRKWTATVVPLGDRWARRAVAVLAVIVVFLLAVGYFWIFPAAIESDLAGLSDDFQVAEKKWATLRRIPFWSRKADEGWADYFVRRSNRAATAEDRDAALLWRIRAVQVANRDIDRRAAQSLTLADYPALERTFRPPHRVTAAAVSPSGDTVLTGSSDSSAQLWNARTGSPIWGPLLHKSTVSAVAFSPGGGAVLIGSYGTTAELRDARTGSRIGQPLIHQDGIFAVAYSPSGSTVCTGSFDRSARLWDARTGSPIGQPLKHRGPINSIAFSPDGESVLTGSADGTAQIWDAHSGASVGQPLAHPDGVVEVAFNPSGDTVLTRCIADNTARLWDVHTGEGIGQALKHRGPINSMAFSQDGSFVLTGSADGTTQIWNGRTGSPIGKSIQHQGSVFAVAFSSKTNNIFAVSHDKVVRIWDVRSSNPIGQPYIHQDIVVDIAFSPDGDSLMTRSEGSTVRLWDVHTDSFIGMPLQRQDSVFAVAFSPRGDIVLTDAVDKTAQLWDARTGLSIGQPLQHPDSVVAVAFGPGGDTVLTGSLDGTARQWDAETGSPIGQPFKHQDSVFAVAYSPGGDFIITGSDDRTAQLWDARTGSPIGHPLQHQDRIVAVAYSPDGDTIITGSDDRTAQLWNARTGSSLGDPLDHEGSVSAVAFSRDGNTVLTGSDDGTVRIWDARSGSPIGGPLQHQDKVGVVAFSPDSKHFITGTGTWLFVFAFNGNDATPVSSFYVGKMVSHGVHFDDPQGQQLTVLTTAGQVSLRKIAIDFSNLEPLPGEPAALIEDWQQRLGLKIDNRGRLMTAASEEWIEGFGIRQISHEPKRPSIRNPDSGMLNETEFEN